jgi:hypothetical protein
MANSYTATPAIIPGNLSVGGDLDVKGTVLVGPFTQRLRLFGKSAGQADITMNLGTDQSTQDDNTAASAGFKIGTLPGWIDTIYVGPNGALSTGHLGYCMDSDNVDHVHTGDTTLDQIYSTIVPKGIMGNNGQVRGKVCFVPTVQGATASNLIIKLVAATIATIPISTAYANHEMVVEFVIGNKNANNSQQNVASLIVDGNVVVIVATQTAVDTTANATVTVNVQNNAASDSQTLHYYELDFVRT